MNMMPTTDTFIESGMTNTATGSDVLTDWSEKEFEIDETYWGYVIRDTRRAKSLTLILQFSAWFFGIAFGGAALGLWVLPEGAHSEGLLAMKFGASVMLAAISAFFMWFASRGSKVELQVDTRLAELREVVRNRAGRSTLIGRYGFDAIGGVFMARSEKTDKKSPRLVLRYRNTSQLLTVASGLPNLLEPLRDRLGRDLMLGGDQAALAA